MWGDSVALLPQTLADDSNSFLWGGAPCEIPNIAFVLAACDHGTMIVNRFDYRMVDQDRGFGVGFQILETASFDPAEIDMALSLLDLRRQYFGHGVVALDCGAMLAFTPLNGRKK